MNNTTTPADPATLVQYYNDEIVSLLTPVIIYITVLMIFGLIGNLMVFFYYALKSKLVPTTVFIINLAVYDLIVCIFGMPTEIADIAKFYTFTDGAACRFLRFLEFFSAIASMLMLLVIALDRYRHIRFATGKQLTLKQAKIRCVIVAGVSVLLSWPAVIINDAVSVPVANDKGLDLWGSDCTTIKTKSYEPFVLAFNGFHLLAFIASCIALIFFYGTIGRTIYLHRKRQTKRRKPAWCSSSTKYTVSSSGTDTQVTTITENGIYERRDDSTTNKKFPPRTHKENTTKTAKNTKDTRSADEQKRVSFGGVTTPKKSNHIDNETLKITLLMISISVLFIISVLPYLALVIWRAAKGEHEAKLLSGAALVAFRIGSRSYLLNSSLNPWVYGIFNTRFRQHYYDMVCCKCCD